MSQVDSTAPGTSLGERNLSTVHAVAQSLAIGPMFSVALILGGISRPDIGAGWNATLAVLIATLGVLAIGWSLIWRARSALIQGLFLGALGVGVLGNTAYRLLVANEPDASLMGLFGLVALGVNVLAAVMLLPHRTGDANVRAVWLFSRNDAIGNAAVVVAALDPAPGEEPDVGVLARVTAHEGLDVDRPPEPGPVDDAAHAGIAGTAAVDVETCELDALASRHGGDQGVGLAHDRTLRPRRGAPTARRPAGQSSAGTTSTSSSDPSRARPSAT